jgi:branched-chain amino acid transport system ATP-binding protein
MLKCDNITLRFGGVSVLGNVSLEVEKGEIFTVIGPNGSGKTSLLNCVNGFYKPNSGKIYLNNDKDITSLPPYKIAALGIGRVFQGMQLYAGLSVLDNLMAGRHLRMSHSIGSELIYFGKAHEAEILHREKVEEIMHLLELEPIRKKLVAELPMGLRRRVDLGRALAIEPSLLLLDEPTGGMNVEEKEDMARFIIDVREESGTTIILVEHDMEIVMDISDRIAVLDFGSKIAEGLPEEIRFNPKVVSAYLGEV